MMQPVERKKKRTRKHGLGMLAAGACVLFCGILAAFLFWPKQEQEGTGSASAVEKLSGMETADTGILTDAAETADAEVLPDMETAEGTTAGTEEPPLATDVSPEADKPEETYGMLQVRAADELESVTVLIRGQEPWTVIRDEAGNMRLKGSEDWVVKERLADRIKDAMTILVYEDIVTEDPAEYQDRLAEFGLDDPYIVAEAHYTDGSGITVRLGDEIPIEKSVRYMLVDGDERLYAVSHSLAEDLEIDEESLHPVTQPEIYPVLLDRITVYGRDGKEKAEWRLRGAITDQDAGTNWELTAPVRYCADDTMIQNLKTSAGNLRMGVFLGDATEERLAELGLAEPDYTLELHMAAGSTGTVSDLGVYDVVEREASTVALAVSRSDNEMIDHVLFGDEIFTVSHFSLSAFLDADPADTMARYIAPVPLGSLESMTIEKNGITTEYTLERTGETDPETAEEKIICRKDGEEISREAFEAAYERLMTVTVSGSLPEGAEWKEPHTKYTFRAVSGGTHTAEFSEWDGLHDAVTLDGNTMFYLVQHGAEFTYEQ